MKASGFTLKIQALAFSWRLGLLLAALLRMAGLALMILLAYFFIDYFFGLEVSSRIVMTLLALTGLLTASVRWLIPVFGFSSRDVAREVDSRLKLDSKNRILSAVELQQMIHRRKGKISPLEAYLIERCISEARGHLINLPRSVQFPYLKVARQAGVLAAQAIVAIGLAIVYFAALGTILYRILAPLDDVPPYSRYSFTVEPSKPQVLYASSTTISVEIEGDPVHQDVCFVTKNEGLVQQSICYKESPTRYSARLENVVQPVQFCFSLGKARSPWQPLKVLLEPHIALVNVMITPPGYTNGEPRSFLMAGEGIKVLRHSKVSIALTSNRPLDSGLLTLRSTTNSEMDQTIAGYKRGSHTIVFEWTASDTSEASLIIRDILGTPNREPFTFRQTIVADNAPTISLHSPQGTSLATPDITIPVEATVEDDISIKKVEIIRTLEGYLDRGVDLGPSETTTRMEINRGLNLSGLGVKPGDVLEISFEARDTNPSLLGITTSDKARIEIISTQEYAELNRSKSDIEEITARLHAMQQAMKNALDALRKLEETARSNPSAEDKQQALEDALEKLLLSEETANRLAEDFPVYDIESSLQDFAKKMRGAIRGARESLEPLQGDDPALAGKASQARAAIEKQQEEMNQTSQKAEHVASAAKIMRQASRFNEMRKRQSDLVRELNRSAALLDRDTIEKLPKLRQDQEQIKQDLLQLIDDMRETALQLPPQMHQLFDDTVKFANDLANSGVVEDMNDASKAAINQDVGGMYKHAQDALDKMNHLVKNNPKNCFSGLTQGEIFFKLSDSMCLSLQQMLRTMCRTGSPPGRRLSGSGFGTGDLDDGFWSNANTPLNTPMYGPRRSRFHKEGSGSLKSKQCEAAQSRVADPDRNTLDVETPDREQGQNRQAPQFPEKYRKALQRYFTPESSAAGQPNPPTIP